MKINNGHYLELMDRLHVQLCTIEDHLLGHPLTQNEKQVEELIQKASDLLAEAYQVVGNLEPQDEQ